MNSKLKALGLALCAVFALSAVSATGASAVTHEFHAGAEPTHLTAEATTEQAFRATTDVNEEVKCKKVSVEGTVEKTQTSVTVTPNYEECETYKNEVTQTVANVDFTSCHYVFTGETTETVTPGEHATAHIKCDVPNDEIHVFVTFLELECITLPEQSVHGIHYDNKETEGVKDIEVTATVHGITSTTEGACKSENPEENTHHDGSYTGSVTVSGHNNAEEAVDVYVE